MPKEFLKVKFSMSTSGEGKIILTEQEQPGKKTFIGAAGGRIDEEETPIEAAHRELLEEKLDEMRELFSA